MRMNQIQGLLQQTVESPVDVELAAREANVRRWWRRAIALIVCVLIGSPILSLLIWRVHLGSLRAENSAFPANSAGPPDRALKDAYRQYHQNESAAKRANDFIMLVSMVEAFRKGGRNFSESEVLFYLGEPDERAEVDPTTKTFTYYYKNLVPRDCFAICTLTAASAGEPFNLSQAGFNAVPPAIPTTRAASAPVATSQPR